MRNELLDRGHVKAVPAGHIMTYTGRMIDPLDLNELDVDIRDIAHALSNTCRFGGHSRRFYSVAEHSILVTLWLMDQKQPASGCLWGLLHDAAEAYLGDVPSPYKSKALFRVGNFHETYKEVENRTMSTIASAFGLPRPMPLLVHEIDRLVLNYELGIHMGLHAGNPFQNRKSAELHKALQGEGSIEADFLMVYKTMNATMEDDRRGH